MVTKKKRGTEGGAKRAVRRAAPPAPRAAEAAGPDAPRDLYSLRQLAGLLKVDRNRLAEQVRDLESFEGPRGSRLYSLAAVEEVLASDPDPDLKEARLQKLRAEAGLAELKLRRESGQLLEARGVLGRTLNVFRAWHRRLMVQMPAEISPQLHKAESADHVAEILRAHLGRLFDEFRRDHLGFIKETEGFEGGAYDETV